MLDTLLVALVISVDTAQVKEFPLLWKFKADLMIFSFKSFFLNSTSAFCGNSFTCGKKDDKTWNWKIQDVVFRKD